MPPNTHSRFLTWCLYPSGLALRPSHQSPLPRCLYLQPRSTWHWAQRRSCLEMQALRMQRHGKARAAGPASPPGLQGMRRLCHGCCHGLTQPAVQEEGDCRASAAHPLPRHPHPGQMSSLLLGGAGSARATDRHMHACMHTQTEIHTHTSSTHSPVLQQ